MTKSIADIEWELEEAILVSPYEETRLDPTNVFRAGILKGLATVSKLLDEDDPQKKQEIIKKIKANAAEYAIKDLLKNPKNILTERLELIDSLGGSLSYKNQHGNLLHVLLSLEKPNPSCLKLLLEKGLNMDSKAKKMLEEHNAPEIKNMFKTKATELLIEFDSQANLPEPEKISSKATTVIKPIKKKSANKKPSN